MHTMTKWIFVVCKSLLLLQVTQAANPRIPGFDKRVPRRQGGNFNGRPQSQSSSSSSSSSLSCVGEDNDEEELLSYSSSSPVFSQDLSDLPIDYDDEYGMPEQPPPPPPPPFSWPQQQQQETQQQSQQQQQQQQQQQNSPPQQQHPLQRNVASSKRIPIHYQFRNKRDAASTYLPPSQEEEDNTGDFIPPVTFGADDEMVPYPEDEMEDEEDGPSFASPRKDAVTTYLASTSLGRYKLMLSSGVVGAAAGAFVGKSLFSSRTLIQQCVLFWFVLFLLGTALRNPYGELVRALGLALIYTIQETKTIRRRYPVGWQRLRLAISFFTSDTSRPLAQRRQPFPKRPEDFSRVYALVAMALIGSICGSNVPIIPSWLGAMIAAVGMAFSTTLPDARGDLARIMAMRVVALTTELWQIQQELEIVPKVGVVSGLILDKIMILDRQHRIKEKVGSFLTSVYTQIARVVQQSQQQQQQGPRNDGPKDTFTFGGGEGRNRREGPPLSTELPRNIGRFDDSFDERRGRRPDWEPQRGQRPDEPLPRQPQQPRGKPQPPIPRQQRPPPEQQRENRGRF